MTVLEQSILANGANICKYYQANPDYIKTGSLIPGLILVSWVLKSEIGTITNDKDKVEYWKRAKELRPEADRSQLIDTAIALFVYNKITNEKL